MSETYEDVVNRYVAMMKTIKQIKILFVVIVIIAAIATVAGILNLASLIFFVVWFGVGWWLLDHIYFSEVG